MKKIKIYHITINKLKCLLILLFLISNIYLLSSQTLVPLAETAFEKQLPFNVEFIKQQHIKSITFDIIDKKDMQVAEDKGLLNYYEFNTQGLLTRYYYTNIAKIIQKEFHTQPVYRHRKKISNGYTYTKNEYVYDTTSTVYYYNENNSIKLKRFNDGAFYESYYYTYYADGKMETQKRCKETNSSDSKLEFKLGSQLVITDESYLYKMASPTQYKKVCLNDEERPYKEIIYNYNTNKQLLNYNEQYTATFIKQESNFTYNTLGQLTSATYKSNTTGDLEQKRTYEYDSNNCLLTEKQFKNNELIKEISYVTDATKKLTSYIIRDANNQSMRIVKLFYN